MSFKQVHRYLGLSLAMLWLVQAATGTLSVFRWEIDDATVAGAVVPVDWQAVGNRIDSLNSAPATSVSSVWTSGTSKLRFDIHHEVGGVGRVMRVDGQGRPLRIRSADWLAAQGAIWDSITTVHTKLFAGSVGSWLIGMSGMLLLTNIILGLKLAWPRRGSWKKTLLRRPAGGSAARLYGWHRKVGLWFAIPALFTVSAGVSMVFVDSLEAALDAGIEEPNAAGPAPATHGIGTTKAVVAALARFPKASFSGLSMPDNESPWYRIRLLNSGEVLRKWGTTTVFVSQTGRVLGAYDAADPTPARAVVDTLYPLHTGQIGGVIGRIIVFLLGCALFSLLPLGIALWWMRRKAERARHARNV